MSKPVILTGLRTNAEYHLGNYLGAIQPMVQLQRRYVGEYQINMFAPDLHSFTTPTDHKGLYEQTMANLRVFVAAGMPLEDENFKLYRQSHISAHSELTVILNNFAYFGELSRMTQFKEKSDELKQKSVSAGLFDYPVLMASDILLYGAQWVPVGDDQQQHLEFARNLGERFNNKFGSVFTLPEPVDKQLEFAQRSEGVRVRSLRNPKHKMSKSVEDPAGTILLSDTPADAAEKIKSATTDSVGTIGYDWDNQPGISNLLQILALLGDKPQEEVINEWRGKTGYGELKDAAAEAVQTFLTDYQSRYEQVDPESVLDKLERDEADVSAIANETLARVQRAVGLRPHDA